MAEKILVPLKRRDRIEEIIPDIEKVTQPGVSVVFLVHATQTMEMGNFWSCGLGSGSGSWVSSRGSLLLAQCFDDRRLRPYSCSIPASSFHINTPAICGCA